MRRLTFILTVVSILSIFVLAGCAGEAAPYKKDFILMDTLVTVDIRQDMSEDRKAAAALAAAERMRSLERRFSYFLEDSEIGKINRLKKGEEMALSAEMLDILRQSARLEKITASAFDPASGAILRVWSKAEAEGVPPSEKEIEEAIKRSGPGTWALDPRRGILFFKRDGVNMNLGGVAKGFIVDEGIKILKENGIKNALVNAGGDIYALGPGSGPGWKIGIRDPLDENKVIARFTSGNRGIATSGGYERFLRIRGRKYPHIIDPRTGYPVGEIAKSVTVIAESCMAADALATALYVLGPREGLSMIESVNTAECVIITENGDRFISGGLRGRIEWSGIGE